MEFFQQEFGEEKWGQIPILDFGRLGAISGGSALLR